MDKGKYIMKNGKAGFRGDYGFLSNFHILDEGPICVWGIEFITSEHLYVACKTDDKDIRHHISYLKCGAVKRFGRSLKIRDNWERDREVYMYHTLKAKFDIKYRPKLAQKLIDTGDEELVEWNVWNDKFWGVCVKTGKGKNKLGKLLMQIRDELTGSNILG